MTIKISTTCSRCHREDVHEIESLATATAFEDLQKKKAATLVKIQAFLASLPVEELPDFLAVLGDKSLVHSYLCDPVEDADGKGKRSCTKRVGELLSGVAELGPRKPKAKKEKTAEPEKAAK